MLDSLEIHRDEGGLGTVAESGTSLVIYGRGKITKHLETFHDQSRVAFQHLFGERGLPDFLGYCPITTRDESLAVAMFGIYGVAETDKGEWERLITLAAGLYSLRLTMHSLSEAAQKAEQAPSKIDAPAEFLNRLNNLLSAVIGTAELVAQKDDLPVETANQIQQIIDKAEEAAAIGRESLIASVGSGKQPTETPGELNRIIESELARHHVSGDIYMAGQRPREVRLNLSPVGPTEFSDEKVQQLFRSALNRFAASAAETDVLSIATYARDNYIYLDVSRHGSNFSAVEKVAGFGRYVQSSEAFRNRPGDIYLRHLDEADSYYAVDTGGTAPAFLSFKFPARTGADQVKIRPGKAKVKLLAIDDQSVILDLISAMGRSLGYQVETAATGEAGVELAELSQFDVILADLALPGISGMEVAKRISQRQPSVPIVLVTGWATEIDPNELEEAGIVKVLYKPFRIEQLTNVVQSVVSSRVSF
jgi:two-component system response regulator (stage 0 sporulation protein F)